MTFAWYWHLRPAKAGAKPWPLVAIILTSWLIALVEYCIAVPANRIGNSVGLNVAQLKNHAGSHRSLRFVPFMLFFMRKNGTGTTSGRSSAWSPPSTSSTAAKFSFRLVFFDRDDGGDEGDLDVAVGVLAGRNWCTVFRESCTV